MQTAGTPFAASLDEIEHANYCYGCKEAYDAAWIMGQESQKFTHVQD